MYKLLNMDIRLTLVSWDRIPTKEAAQPTFRTLTHCHHIHTANHHFSKKFHHLAVMCRHPQEVSHLMEQWICCTILKGTEHHHRHGLRVIIMVLRIENILPINTKVLITLQKTCLVSPAYSLADILSQLHHWMRDNLVIKPPSTNWALAFMCTGCRGVLHGSVVKSRDHRPCTAEVQVMLSAEQIYAGKQPVAYTRSVVLTRCPLVR